MIENHLLQARLFGFGEVYRVAGTGAPPAAEPLGADTLLHGRFGSARELVTVRQGGHVTAQPGEKRRFSIGATRLHLFDSQTGRRIADA